MMDPVLYKAARSGATSFLETLTADEETRYFSQLTPNHNTVFHVAAEFGQADFLQKVCLKCTPRLIWQPNSEGETVLHVSARVGCVEIVRFLIQKALVSPYIDEQGRQHNLIRKKNKAGDTALHCAVRNCQFYVVEFLLKTDPELSSFCNYSDESPLFLAASHNYFKKIGMLIIRLSSSSFSGMGPKGLTALHEIVGYKFASKAIEELVLKRPEMITEADDILGWTPLHYAAFYGSFDAVEILIKHDASSSAAYLLDHDGHSALHIAAFMGNVGVVENLLQNCPDIFELTNTKGQTALHVAVLNKKAKVVEYILGSLQLGWLLNKPDEDGNTPLHLAVLFNNNKIIELLAKDLRVDLNATNKELKTAHHIYVLSFKENGFTKTKIRSLLLGGLFAGRAQHFFRDISKEWLNKKPKLKPYLVGQKECYEQGKEISKKFTEIYLIVATLVSTISFSAAFVVPGGYRSEGPEIGKPVLADKLAFSAFYIFNIISLSASLSAVFFQQDTAPSGRLSQRYSGLQASMLAVAILALGLAFASGIYVTLANSNHPLAITPYVVFCCLVVIYIICVMLDPTGGKVSGKRTWRFGKYVFELKYGAVAGSPLPVFTYHIVGQKKYR